MHRCNHDIQPSRLQSSSNQGGRIFLSRSSNYLVLCVQALGQILVQSLPVVLSTTKYSRQVDTNRCNVPESDEREVKKKRACIVVIQCVVKRSVAQPGCFVPYMFPSFIHQIISYHAVLPAPVSGLSEYSEKSSLFWCRNFTSTV